MLIGEILLERSRRKTGIMYHGTSSVYLDSILSNGLLSNPPRATYSRDTNMDDPAYDTFSGGVYLTNKFDNAVDNAEDSTKIHGGSPIVVVVQYVVGSEQVDEDDITSLIKLGFSGVLDSSTITTGVLTRDDFLKLLDMPGNFRNARNNFIRYISGHRAFRRVSNRAVTSTLGNMFDYVVDFVRNLNKGDIRINSIMQTYFLNMVRHKSRFEGLMRELMREMSPSGSGTVRIARDIGYRGKTRILRIVDGHDSGRVYYES